MAMCGLSARREPRYEMQCTGEIGERNGCETCRERGRARRYERFKPVEAGRLCCLCALRIVEELNCGEGHGSIAQDSLRLCDDEIDRL